MVAKFIKPRKRPVMMTDLLAVGEGAEKGRIYDRAAKLAARGSKARIVIVDLKTPEYRPPQNLAFVSMDIIKFLEGAPFNSVKKVEDKYFFSNAMWGKHGASEERTKAAIHELEKLQTLSKFGAVHIDPKKLPPLKKGIDKYLKLVRRALVPGGRFVIMTSSDAVTLYMKQLECAGFKIANSRTLTREQIMKSGSEQAIYELEKHNTLASIITAIKPK